MIYSPIFVNPTILGNLPGYYNSAYHFNHLKLPHLLHSKPAVVTHWTVRSAAAKSGISKSAVGRYFALFGVQPHRSRSFKLSTDRSVLRRKGARHRWALS